MLLTAGPVTDCLEVVRRTGRGVPRAPL